MEVQEGCVHTHIHLMPRQLDGLPEGVRDGVAVGVGGPTVLLCGCERGEPTARRAECAADCRPPASPNGLDWRHAVTDVLTCAVVGGDCSSNGTRTRNVEDFHLFLVLECHLDASHDRIAVVIAINASARFWLMFTSSSVRGS